MPEDSQGVTWEKVAQVALWILGGIVAVAVSLMLTILISQASSISDLKTSTATSIKTLQDGQNMDLWRIQQLEAQTVALKDDVGKLQLQSTLQQNDITSLRREMDDHQDWIEKHGR